VKYTPTWARSFTPSNQEMRNLVAEMKQIPVPELIEGKKLLLVDDSIVRGTQLRETVDFLYKSGAKEVHMRSACPPIMYSCKYLNFSSSNSEMELLTRKTIQNLEGAIGQKHLAEYADANRGFQLREVAGGWRLYSHPAYHELIEKYVLSWDTRRLSQAALETLAIIAYGQPITRQGISSIRGVNSDSSVNSLIDKGLVRESGTADAPGYPMTYSTTRTFLEKFGLRDTGDLPDLEGFAPDEETSQLLREGLSMHAHYGLVEDGEPDWAQAPLPMEAEDLQDGQEADMREMLREAMADALAQSAGVVEKIDFDQLEFEE
jgi:segregation and condensation protein B